MRNEEYMTPVGLGTPEAGRNEISLEAATIAQSKILELMIPSSIRPYLRDPSTDHQKDDPILIELGNRFAMKYLLGFNGFTEYCNKNNSDAEFMTRAKLGQLTEVDYTKMIFFFENSEQGEPFFADESQVQEFLKPFMH